MYSTSHHNTTSRRRYRRGRNQKGGKMIDHGGYGCVFQPTLMCDGATQREPNKISKLMSTKHAQTEFDEIKQVKQIISAIPNYDQYFLVDNVTMCRPAPLTEEDKLGLEKCGALPGGDKVKPANINANLQDLSLINLPNGGINFEKYIHTTPWNQMGPVLDKLLDMFLNGLLKMNELHIYHNDVKDTNILVDTSAFLTSPLVKIIDWGFLVTYDPTQTQTMPKKWIGRGLQFNNPFTLILFNNTFYDRLAQYLREGKKIEDSNAMAGFIDAFILEWLQIKKNNHMTAINDILFMLHKHSTLEKIERPENVEFKYIANMTDEQFRDYFKTNVTLPVIRTGLVAVLQKYTVISADGTANISSYFDNVFIHIVDVWGFVFSYLPFLDILFANYTSLQEPEKNLFLAIKQMFSDYLFSPILEPYDVDKLMEDCRRLHGLILAVQRNFAETKTVT